MLKPARFPSFSKLFNRSNSHTMTIIFLPISTVMLPNIKRHPAHATSLSNSTASVAHFSPASPRQMRHRGSRRHDCSTLQTLMWLSLRPSTSSESVLLPLELSTPLHPQNITLTRQFFTREEHSHINESVRRFKNRR